MSEQAVGAKSLLVGLGAAVQGQIVWILAVPLVAWFSWPTLAALHGRWIDFGYEHGYLVLALCVALVARECRRVPLRTGAGSPWGLLCLAVASAGVIASQAATVELLASLLLPVVWFSASWALCGWAQSSRLLGPLAYFYFAVPIWDALTPALQSLTVEAVTISLRMLRVPAFIEGNFIHLRAGSFEVAGGCSGLHYVVVGAALAALLGLLDHERWRTRAVLMAVAIALAVLANWLRVVTIVVAGHVTDMQHYLVADHYYFGWILFIVVFSPLFHIEQRLARSATAGVRPCSATSLPRWRAPGVAVTVLALVLLATGAQYGQRLARDAGDAPGGLSIEIAVPEAWRRAGEWADARRPVFVGAVGEDGAWVTDGTHTIGSFVAAYLRQRQEGEVASALNRPEGAAAHIVAAAPVAIPAKDGVSLPFHELEVRDGDGQRRLVWVQMRVGGRVTASVRAARLLQVGGVLIGRRDAQAVVLTTVCATSCAEARSVLSDYAARSASGGFWCGTGRAGVANIAQQGRCAGHLGLTPD